MRAAFRSLRAATAVATVSPATKRDAKRRASPLRRTKPKIRGCSLSHSRPARIMASRVELGVAAGQVLQDVARREAGTVALGQALQVGHDPCRAEVVGVAQGTAAKRRESEAEDGADVAVS